MPRRTKAQRGGAGEREIDERVRSVLVDGRPGIEDVGLARLDSVLSALRSHSPGSSSLLPAVNAVSSAFASAVCLTSPAACRPCQSMRGGASIWFPSAPWNEESVSGTSEGSKDAPRAGGAKRSADASSGRPHSRARRRREAGPPERDIERKVAATRRKPQTSRASSQRRSLRIAIPAPPARISAEAQAASTRSGIGIERASFVSTLSACSIGP